MLRYISSATSKASCMALKRMRGSRQSPTTWTSGATSRKRLDDLGPRPQVGREHDRIGLQFGILPLLVPYHDLPLAHLLQDHALARPDAVLVQVVLQHDDIDEVHRLIPGRACPAARRSPPACPGGPTRAPPPSPCLHPRPRRRPRPAAAPAAPFITSAAKHHVGPIHTRDVAAGPARPRPRRPLRRGLPPSPGRPWPRCPV